MKTENTKEDLILGCLLVLALAVILGLLWHATMSLRDLPDWRADSSAYGANS